MSKRKTAEELVAELELFNHHESAKLLRSLLQAGSAMVRSVLVEHERLKAERDRIVAVAVSASNDAERALREEGLL